MIQRQLQKIEPKTLRVYFWLFILVHTLLWTLGPTLFRPTIPHDTLEGITWGLQWQLGYNKHPFLTAWLSAGITRLLGSLGWPVYLLAQLAVSTTFFAVWRLAQLMFPLAQALIGTLALEGIFFYNLNSFNLTPDTLQSPLWALEALFFYQALIQQNFKYWFLVALVAALCFCTKYQALFLFLPLFLFCLIHPFARKSFSKPWIYCSLILFLLFISPHLIWLSEHQFITLTYARKISTEYSLYHNLWTHLTQPLNLLLNSLLNVSGLFLLFWPFYRQSQERPSVTSFQKQFLFMISLGPFMLTLILCFIRGDYFPPRWCTPYFFSLGLYMMALLKPALTYKQLKQFGFSLILLSLLIFSMRMSSFIWVQRPASDAFLPNKKIALYLSQLWESHYHSKLPFLAGSHYLVAGVLPYLSKNTIPYLSWDSNDSSWINEQYLHQQGGIFIWDVGGYYTWDKQSRLYTSLPNSVLKRFPKLEIQAETIFYRLSDKQPIVVGIALLPPDPKWPSKYE